jgi:hypothetical protein
MRIYSGRNFASQVTDNSTCRLSKLKHDEPLLMQYFHSVEPLSCNDIGDSWCLTKNGYLYYDDAKISCNIVYKLWNGEETKDDNVQNGL